MNLSEKMVWKIYASLLGAATTLAAQKLVNKAWKTITGDQPPNPSDPSVPFTEAVIWALASGLGVGVAQLTMNRYMANQWQARMGQPHPGKLKTKLD